MTRALAILLLTSTMLFVISPVLTPGFSGFTQDQFPSPEVAPPIVPAGYAFSIWGVIYLWLMGSAAYGLFARADAPGWVRFRGPLFVSTALGASWLAVAMRDPALATGLIWVMLVTAIWALLRTTAEDFWWQRAPIALYAGWLTAAAFVALAVSGAGYGVGPGPLAWAWIALLGAIGVARMVQMASPSALPYGWAVGWALIGVAVANWERSLPISLVALLGVVGMAALQLRLRRARP